MATKASMGFQEDYIETVFTCEGDFHDPHLKDRLEDFQKSLKDLLLTDKNKLILKKVEPWNSVRVTFKIPREAALRLKQLAQQGNTTLRELGVLTVKIQDQNISLTIAGKNNERTQLVFRTADTFQDVTPSLSVYDKHSPSLDELGPQGPGPGHLETNNKNIVDYLRQGPTLLDLFSQHATEEKLLGPQCDGAKAKINNILSEHDMQQKSFQQASTQSGHFGQASHVSVNSLNTSKNPVGQGVLRFPQVAGLSPGFPSGLAPGPSRHSLDSLPPPPPYPEGSSYLNNLQKLHIGSNGPNPSLVNLLQNDPNLSSLLAAGRLAPSLDQDSLQPLKKKRKPRKPREKKKEAKLHISSSISNAGISGPSAEAISVSSHVAPSVNTSSFMNLEGSHAVSEQVFHTVPKAVMYSTHAETKSEQIVALSSIATPKKSDESDTAGKIINPVTGLLEPIENLSDTSPTKSDGDKQSPHSFTESSFQSPIRETDNVVGYPVWHPKQSNQMQNSDYSRHNLSPGQTMLSSSSQFGSNALCDLLHQKRLKEAVKLEMVKKTRLKNEILPHLNIAQQTYSASKYSGSVERNGDNNSSTDGLQEKKERGEKRKEVIPQEIDTKSIPLLLLNKPLLQVKHDHVTGKPSGSSPDSNGVSKCSTQSLNLDSCIRSDPGGQSGPLMDTKAYNNDSGVGSCSERSNDAPSDHGDSDYKSGNTNSVECAKPSIIVPVKQVPPNSNIMTVGFAVKETQMDNTNHKIVSTWLGSDKLLNSSLSKTKFKVEQLDMCPTSHTCHSNWTIDEQLQMANHVDSGVKQSVHGSSNTRSAKLAASFPKSIHHGIDEKFNYMQGHTGPLSMQKKKANLRDNTRSCSPRNTCSPRNISSSRSCSSNPRTIGLKVAGPLHQAFLDRSAQILDTESQTKSPYGDQGRSHNSEQRKSYNMSAPQSPYSPWGLNLLGTHTNNAEAQVDRNHVEMESVMRKQQQCNNDHILFLKSLEVVRQQNMLASTKDATFLPLNFQKTQRINMVQSMPNGVENFNTNDNVSDTSRSPGPSAPIHNGTNNTNVMDAHTDHVVVHNCMLSEESDPLSNVQHASSNCDKDNSNSRTNSKGSKLHSEELKGATNSSCRRSSPGAASSISSSLHQSYNSTLPQPKRLTESVQKLLTLPLLDTSLPHVTCRSPSSNAAITKLTTGVQSTAKSLGSSQAPVLTSSRNLNGDSAHIDLDSITPSITWFGLGTVDFRVDTSCHSLIDIISTEHSCMTSTSFIDNYLVNVSHPTVESPSSTKLVSVHTGLVSSIKAGESFVSQNIGSEPHTSKTQNGSDIQIPVESELQAIVCNSESKMAGNNALESKTFDSHVCTTQVGPTIWQPHNERYNTVQKHLEHPKNPFQQMQLSEMLQVSANIHSSSTGRLSPFVSEKAISSPIQNTSSADTEKLDKAALFVEHLKLNKESHNHDNSSISETKQFMKCDSVYVTAQLPENGDNSDIPKLKRQTCVLDTKSFSFNMAAINVLCDGDLDKSLGSYIASNYTLPILTAVPEEMENYSKHACALSVQNDVVSEQSNVHVAVDCSKPDHVNTEISFNKSNISTKEENTIYDKNTSLPEHTGYSILQNAPTFNSVTDVQHARNIWTHMSSVSVEDSLEDLGVAPRQLRSRKITNVFELDIATHDDSKRIKLDNSSDAATKCDHAKKCFKVQGAKLNSSVNSLPVVTTLEDNFKTELGKSGLRARINSKNLPADEKEKAKPPTGRDHKDIKTVVDKSIDKKSEAIEAEDSKRNQQLHRNQHSEPVSDEQSSVLGTSDKSPLHGSKAKVQNSPVVMDTNEDFQENRRTTRSVKSKEKKGKVIKVTNHKEK